MKHKKGEPANADRRVARAGSGNPQSKNTRKPFPTQPGTALTAFLKKYKFDLLSLPYSRHISELVDCCDFILDEVEWGQS